MTPTPNRIKELRTAKGWTAERVALKAGCSITYVNKLERGLKKNPGLALAVRVAQALDASLSEVFPDAMPHGTLDT